jgi:hypothetical protein
MKATFCTTRVMEEKQNSHILDHEMELSYGAVEKIIRCQIHCLKIIRLGLPLQSIFLLPSFYALSLFDRGISKMYGWLLEHL